MRRKLDRDEGREDRIANEVLADANDVEEQATGWFNYLEEKLEFPFTAKCTMVREISVLEKGDEVEILGLAGSDECRYEMFVRMRWSRSDGLAVPLSQLKLIGDAEGDTAEAIADWHYWVSKGGRLG